VPGIAVNRAREGTAGGETKSDPRDARTIADLVRTRRDLRKVTANSELDIELRLLVSRRRDLTEDWLACMTCRQASFPSSNGSSICVARRI
jgi:transposase